MGLPQAKDAAPADGASEGVYEALLATLSASALGRGFLAEYARRQRLAETETLLAAMTRLEAMVAAQQRRAAAPAEPAPVIAGLVAAAPLPLPETMEPTPPRDAYEQLMILTDEERIALFS